MRLADQPRALGIELRGRLVEDEVLRAHGEQSGQRQQLLLPAGEPLRIPLGERFDAHRVERLPGPVDHLRTVDAEVHRPEGDLLEDGAGDL
jgi:hypothetical protein